VPTLDHPHLREKQVYKNIQIPTKRQLSESDDDLLSKSGEHTENSLMGNLIKAKNVDFCSKEKES